MASKNIDIKLATGELFTAYLSGVDASPRAAIILLQEIFGVNANMRATADAFAAKGYSVIVPDLFWRQEPGVQLDPANEQDRARATSLMQGLDQNLALDDIMAAASYAKRQLGAQKVGAVGYCLGGKLAYLLAARTSIDAAVSYYGVGIQHALGEAKNIHRPLLVHIAEEDHLCPAAAQHEVKTVLGALTQVAIASYPGVGHAFARLGGSSFEPSSAARADNTTLAFLAEVL